MQLRAVLTTLASLATLATAADTSHYRRTCVVKAGGNNATDDAPAIKKAFKDCGRHGRVIFLPKTYYVNSIMDIRDLEDVEVDIRGTLLWSTDLEYWLENSLEVGFQNQSTAFILGGNNVRIDGHGRGHGTFDGNGDYWYQFIDKQEMKSNFPGRPHALTFNGLTNSKVKGLNFLRSQMWTLSMIHCHHVDLDNIFVNNTGNVVDSFNNDGADTIDSSHINFSRWTIYNGDDAISLKGNSSDITITDSDFYDGSGIALGSIGQFKGEFETMQRLWVENIRTTNTIHAVYFKTWTGDQKGYPPNGGGGGLGFASDMTFRNIETNAIRASVIAVSQCTQFDDGLDAGNCTNSPFQLRNLKFENIRGTSKSQIAASFQCSAVAPCENIEINNVHVRLDNGTRTDGYLCDNAHNLRGFECTGKPCVGGSASGECGG